MNANVTLSLDEYLQMIEKIKQLDNGLLEQVSKAKYFSYDWFRSIVVVTDDELITQLMEKMKEYDKLLNENRTEIRKIEEKYGRPFWQLLGK